MIVQPQLPLNGYMGFSSVLHGRDPQALELLFRLHSSVANPYILDCTWGGGVMWKSCAYQPDIKSDLRNLNGIDMVSDFWELPFLSDLFDAIVFDPPHLPTSGVTAGSSKVYRDVYGIIESGRGRGNKNVIGMFVPFLRETKRVLVDDGIILAKISDHTHGSDYKYHWQQVGFINACNEVGLSACDMLIKIDPTSGNMTSSTWKNQYHLRKKHCFWIVVRKGGYSRRAKI